MTASSVALREARAHPLWERQVQLEERMLCMGADAVRESVSRARTKGHLSTTRPVHRVLADWLPKVAAELVSWRRHAVRSCGAKPIALAYILEEDAPLLALIGLREVLNCVGEKSSRIVALSYAIGRWAEHELKLHHWKATNPEGYKRAQRYYDTEGSTDSHRAKGNLHIFNKTFPGWVGWPDEARFRVGATLLDVIVRATGWFSVEFAEVDGHELMKRKNSKRSIPLMLAVKPDMMTWLGKAFDTEEFSHPRHGPTIIPPRPWLGNEGGGYWTPAILPLRLVRFKASHQEQRNSANEEYDALDMEGARASVNTIQEVPWKINREVLRVVEECWALDMGIAGLPVVSAAPKPPRPDDIDTNEEASKAWRRAAKNIMHRNKTVLSRVRSATKIVRTAGGRTPGMEPTVDPREGSYYQEERFYFPHMLDFRGRMYSVPSGLSPQGHDLSRGLLLFADSKPILEENGGVHWLKLQVANMMGHDKFSTAERLEWVEERHDDWLAVAVDPVLRRDVWAVGKTPWQALAAILDYAGYLKEGPGYRSSLPVTVDGTCNGLQHLSALTHDDESAPLVNLSASLAPHDIYASVATEWTARLHEVQAAGGDNAQFADWILAVWGGVIPRSATKRQVMVLPYGGTRDAFYTYTVEAVEEAIGPPAPTLEPSHYAFRNHAIGMASRLLWEVVNKRLPGAMAIMKWLQACSKVIVEGNQPLYWVVPSGFVVRHFYGQQREGTMKLSINGRVMKVRTLETTKVLDAAAQTRGVPPNFVHSLDGAALSLTINRCAAQGVTHITAIHDAYGTHAADMTKLAKLLRQAFVDVHEANPLDIFWGGCANILEGLFRAQGATEEEARDMAEDMKPPLPPMGTYNVRDVLQSDYFFS